MTQGKNSNDEVSIINRETLNINLGSLKEKPEVLYYHDGSIVLGLNKKPHTLIATIDFDFNLLPDIIKDDIFKCSIVYVVPSKDSAMDTVHNVLPSWFFNFKSLKTLKIEGLRINNLLFLSEMSIENLIISKCLILNNDSTIDAIRSVKGLKYFIHDQSFTKNEVLKITGSASSITAMPISEFEKKAKAGRMNVIE